MTYSPKETHIKKLYLAAKIWRKPVVREIPELTKEEEAFKKNPPNITVMLDGVPHPGWATDL